MGEVYVVIIDVIWDVGFDGFLVFVVECCYFDSNICYGLQCWLGDYNVVWMVVNVINVVNDGLIGCGVFDFVGFVEVVQCCYILRFCSFV